MNRPNGLVMVLLLAALSCSDSGTGISGDDGPDESQDYYVVLAWNDLGMHCLNPTYDQLVLLPPYNNLCAQVIRRGNPPEIVVSGITVDYRIVGNTYSSGKWEYRQFWDNAVLLFGPLFGISTLPDDIGLAGKGLSGQMELVGDHFVAEGIPVTPVSDDGMWDPYQIGEVTVKDSRKDTLASVKATVPASDEINCSKCHGTDPFQDILKEHDEEHLTDLSNSKPVLCAGCHGSPALGQTGPGSSGTYLSKAIHGAHVGRGAACYDCHPGPQTLCNRSVKHTSRDGNCIMCHGTMAVVAGSIPSPRIPWLREPSCAGCHNGASDVNTGAVLYRNAKGHGGVYCIACHGSPHAMIPSDLTSDNYQALQYQNFTGRVKTIGSCGVCHDSSRGQEAELDDFAETHGGAEPEHPTACNVCHTAVPDDTAKWPHSYHWTDSN